MPVQTFVAICAERRGNHIAIIRIRIRENLETDDELDENHVTFQQDGTPLYFDVQVRAYLERHFLDGSVNEKP